MSGKEPYINGELMLEQKFKQTKLSNVSKA